MKESIPLIDPIWYSPVVVLNHVTRLTNSLSEKDRKSKEFRKVVEARAAAITLLGLMKINGTQYWMQIVDDKERSPDIRTISYATEQPEKFDNMEQQDVEVVEYEQHSEGAIPEFLASTKFGPGKSYDEQTHILCHLGEGTVINLPDITEMKNQMAIINTKSPIVLLGATSQEATDYQIIQLNPGVGILVEFNVEDEERILFGRPDYKGIMYFKRGSRKPSVHDPNDKHYPFENIGYVPDKNGNY